MKESFNEQESLQLIREMIDNAKARLEAGSFFYLLWGWLVLAATLIHFGLLYTRFAYPWIVWPVIMVIGLAGTLYGIRKSKRKTQTKTYLATSIGFLWGGFSVMLFILLFAATKGDIQWAVFNILIIALYGLCVFVSGGIIRFKPLIWGGIASWVIAVGSLFIAPPFIFLSIALSIVVSYLIPGYLLRNKENASSHV